MFYMFAVFLGRKKTFFKILKIFGGAYAPFPLRREKLLLMSIIPSGVLGGDRR
jgi:hypothetical protein